MIVNIVKFHLIHISRKSNISKYVDIIYNRSPLTCMCNKCYKISYTWHYLQYKIFNLQYENRIFVIILLLVTYSPTFYRLGTLALPLSNKTLNELFILSMRECFASLSIIHREQGTVNQHCQSFWHIVQASGNIIISYHRNSMKDCLHYYALKL